MTHSDFAFSCSFYVAPTETNTQSFQKRGAVWDSIKGMARLMVALVAYLVAFPFLAVYGAIMYPILAFDDIVGGIASGDDFLRDIVPYEIH
jgi:hypothetical protein